jgi:hypothetical protein
MSRPWLPVILSLLVAGTSSANSDGYIGWQELQFKVGNGWIVQITQADGDYRAGISVLRIEHNGVIVEIPDSVRDQIRAPHLNGVKLLSRCCGDEVVLEIPSFEAKPNGTLEKRTWSLVIKGDKFQQATLGAPQVEPGDGF